MKKVMVAFLFCTVTASQPAIAAVRRTLIDDKPPQLAIARASADNAHVLADLLAITPVIPAAPAICCGIPEIDPDASQIHPEIDGPGTANNRTVSA